MKNIFLTSYLMGGLGNQLFQIAKAKAEGLKNNLDVFFRTNAFIPMEGNQPKKYINNIYRNINFDDTKKPIVRMNEKTFSYYENNTIYNESTEFYGYYQSSKNFLNFRNEIKSLFLPTNEFKEKLKNLYPLIFEENSIAIHIRRGDYLKIPTILPVIDKCYFDNCLEQIKYSHIFIFSNDKEWVQENMSYDNSSIIYNLEDYEELWAMSLCNHNIISNSSFSWWAAYLNENNNQKVFCPSLWFGNNGEKNYLDIYEDGWIKINVKYNNGKLIYED